MSLPFTSSASLSQSTPPAFSSNNDTGRFMRTERACRRASARFADNFRFSSVVPSGEAYPLIEIPCRNAQLSARSNPMASVIRRNGDGYCPGYSHGRFPLVQCTALPGHVSGGYECIDAYGNHHCGHIYLRYSIGGSGSENTSAVNVKVTGKEDIWP